MAGIGGLAGSAIARKAVKDGHEIFGKRSTELDFRDKKATNKELLDNSPDILVIAAARVGGILANSTHPVEFISDNIEIQTNLINAAFEANIDRVVFLGSSCIYPKLAPQPLKEEYLLTGKLEETNEAYAIAKIAGIKLIDAYRKEYDLSWFSVMPTNLYGPGDNFDLLKSHVLPALLAKFHRAKVVGSNQVIIWGDGSPLREFMYVDDLANSIFKLLPMKEIPSLINVGSGYEISIFDLAKKIRDIVGYEGEITFDPSKPNGTPRKLLDSSFLANCGWTAETDLDKGIKLTYDWYTKNLATAKVG